MQEPTDSARRARRLRPVAAVSAGEPDAGSRGADAAVSPVGSRLGRIERWLDVLREERLTVVALALLAAGVVLVMLGWYGAAHTNILTEQIPYLISGGLLGLGLIVVSAILAASARAERQMRALRADLARAMGAVARGGEEERVARVALLVRGGRSYHAAGCPIVEGKQADERPLAHLLAAGYAPCKLCGPD